MAFCSRTFFCLVCLGLLGCEEKTEMSARSSTDSEQSAGLAEVETLPSSPTGFSGARREKIINLLFGRGQTQDIPAALALVEEAALDGDPLGAVWQGRVVLANPEGRVEAAAWFLLVGESEDPVARREAEGEIEGLNLSDEEKRKARERMQQLKTLIFSE